ncbi:hypothetical protein [Candidatus Gromoviella agglomerans]|uniref:hypothetical protein n=1 Tax=Candidatus Gromoviella agglomerans TaxID=2806609 RepID=UPI001E499740|nr:hypothetical protein [Candidatus Gromoviella agglomerans]UFX98150.1 hypothetical protein Gromo_00029 [Candidatus Gromoviella agglomerans]
MIKYISIIISIISTLPLFLSFFSHFNIIKLSFFDKIFVRVQSFDVSHGESFVNLMGFYIVFLSSTHMGVPLLNNNKKGAIMIFLSLIPLFLVISSLQQPHQYRLMIFPMLLIFICILEKLYEMSSLFPTWLMLTRLYISIVLLAMLLGIVIVK